MLRFNGILCANVFNCIFWLVTGICSGTFSSDGGNCIEEDTCIGMVIPEVVICKGTLFALPVSRMGMLMGAGTGMCIGIWTVDSCNGYDVFEWILTGAIECVNI